jgi:hypothetical protein
MKTKKYKDCHHGLSLATDRPGWQFESVRPSLMTEYPSPEALRALDEAQRANPTARLCYLVKRHRHAHRGAAKRTRDTIACASWPRCPKWDYRGPVLVDDYQGRRIVFYLSNEKGQKQ